jgi:hypothetical protein
MSWKDTNEYYWAIWGRRDNAAGRSLQPSMGGFVYGKDDRGNTIVGVESVSTKKDLPAKVNRILNRK